VIRTPSAENCVYNAVSKW